MDPGRSQDSENPLYPYRNRLYLYRNPLYPFRNPLHPFEDEFKKGFRLSAHTLQIQNVINADKLRILSISEGVLNHDPKGPVLNLFNRVLAEKLKYEDIVNCRFDQQWFGDEIDIVITFRSQEIRNRVYENRGLFILGYTFICDELDEERKLIWKILSVHYTSSNLITHNGSVILFVNDRPFTFYSLVELKRHLLSWKFGMEIEDESTDLPEGLYSLSVFLRVMESSRPVYPHESSDDESSDEFYGSSDEFNECSDDESSDEFCECSDDESSDELL